MRAGAMKTIAVRSSLLPPLDDDSLDRRRGRLVLRSTVCVLTAFPPLGLLRSSAGSPAADVSGRYTSRLTDARGKIWRLRVESKQFESVVTKLSIGVDSGPTTMGEGLWQEEWALRQVEPGVP